MSLREQMLGEAQVLNVLEDALRHSGADQTEIVLEATQRGVTRYANNLIHQNVFEADTRVAVRAVVGQASARAFTNDLTPTALQTAIEAATAAARLQPPNDHFIGLPDPMVRPAQDVVPPTLFLATADQSPAERAALVRVIIAASAAAGYVAFGTAITDLTELAVVSSTGVRSYASATSAYLRALVDNGQGTGYADALVRDAALLQPGAIAAEAIAKCRLNQHQIELPPGDYAAILEPDCVADFVRFPVLYGMGADAVERGSSFMAGKWGEAVTGPLVTLWDDPLDPACLPMPIDYEGMPAQRIDLITAGIARGMADDSATAARRTPATLSNGHAASPWEGNGPLPEHVLMAGGTATADDLTRDLDRGLRITRLHYTHCPDAKRVVATGTTRDGTFLVENGSIVAAVKNLRLTQPVLELLASIEAVGQTKPCRDWWAANGMGTTTYVLPTLRVGRCTVTGVTTF
jgi:predicted Zn-dependent protease